MSDTEGESSLPNTPSVGDVKKEKKKKKVKHQEADPEALEQEMEMEVKFELNFFLSFYVKTDHERLKTKHPTLLTTYLNGVK